MGFPTSPTNGQQVTLNYVTYQYDTTNTAWYRVSTSVAEPIGAAAFIQANSAFVQANSAYAKANTSTSIDVPTLITYSFLNMGA